MRRALLFACLVVCGLPAGAAADWIVTPFAGLKFGGETNFVDLEREAGKTKVAVGGAGGWLGDGVFGWEVDLAHVPRFFQRGGAGLVASSHVTTLTGSVLVALPRRLTRESLRPYAVGGVGVMHVAIVDVLRVFKVDSTVAGLAVGGGVMGPLSRHASLRLDLRYLRNLTESDDPAFGATTLRFWRATAGVVLHY
jgi:opacity protein-like surface antigen